MNEKIISRIFKLVGFLLYCFLFSPAKRFFKHRDTVDSSGPLDRAVRVKENLEDIRDYIDKL